MQTGSRAQTLQGHGHWVNTLALSAEYALRTGPFDHTGTAPTDPVEAQQVAAWNAALSLPPLDNISVAGLADV